MYILLRSSYGTEKLSIIRRIHYYMTYLHDKLAIKWLFPLQYTYSHLVYDIATKSLFGVRQQWQRCRQKLRDCEKYPLRAHTRRIRLTYWSGRLWLAQVDFRTWSLLAYSLSKKNNPLVYCTVVFIIIIIFINKVLIKVTLNKVIAGTLHSYLWLKRCESTALTVNCRMTNETKMSLNADGNTAATACVWQQLADCWINEQFYYRAACNADAVLWWEFCLSVCLSVRHTRDSWHNGRNH